MRTQGAESAGRMFQRHIVVLLMRSAKGEAGCPGTKNAKQRSEREGAPGGREIGRGGSEYTGGSKEADTREESTRGGF